MKHNVLITGAKGFVGSAIVNHLHKKNFNIYGMVRKNLQSNITTIKYFTLSDLLNLKNKKTLLGIRTVIHTAGRAHVRFPFLKKNKNKLYNDNIKLTEKIAELVIKNNIKNFIFISSAKVYGEESSRNIFFDEKEKPNPKQEYSISKYKAELKLLEILKSSSTNLTIIRPPMIFGKEPNGNLKILMKAIQYNIPIPLSKTSNKRSFLGLENLCLFIENILTKRINGNLIYNVSDGDPISTRDLTQAIGMALGTKVKYLLFPDYALSVLLKIPIISNTLKPLFKDFVIKSLYTKNINKKMSFIPTHKLISKDYFKFK